MLILGLATYSLVVALAARLLARLGLVLSRGVAAPPGAPALVVAAGANLLIALAVVLEHTCIGGRSLSSLGMEVHVRDLGAALALVALTFGLAAATARAWGAAGPVDLGSLGGAFAALACGAWMEELVFRAYALAWLRPLGPGLAWFASAVVFTLVHVPTSRTDRWALLDWFTGGLALGGVYLVTGSVWTATCVHFARNVANVVWLDPARRASPSRATPAKRSSYYALLGASTLLVAFVLR